MAGRAGRRGLDDSGTVIILCKAHVPEASDLNRIILVSQSHEINVYMCLHICIQGQPTSLESQFRLTYSMILNLMRVETLRCTLLIYMYIIILVYVVSNEACLILFRVEDMIKRSFAEIDSTRHRSDNQEELHSLREKIQSLHNDCQICIQDIDQYYSACVTVTNLRKNMQVCKLALEYEVPNLSILKNVIVHVTFMYVMYNIHV